MVVVFVGGFYSWKKAGKEEMPDFVNDRVTISVSYPGATAQEVEYFVVRPLEEAIKGVDGIEEIRSTASPGGASINAYLEDQPSRFHEIVTEIKNAALDARLPEEITEEPRVRQWQSSKSAIIDIAIFDTALHLWTVDDRKRLQSVALTLENALIGLPQVNSVNRGGFLRDEIRISANPLRLQNYNIPLNALAAEIRGNNQRRPAGSLKDADESKVTLAGELTEVEELKNLIVQGGFDGPAVRLGDVAEVNVGFEETRSIQKVNGHEAVILNVVKNSSAGIIKAVDAVHANVERFQKENLAGESVRILLLDDESRDVRNRLSIIASNGIIGIALILLLLFLFLNLPAGLWVTVGIPFCFGFTLIGAYMMGHTVNNMTLAAVIIVMGMIVDDAIVVAENIMRLRNQKGNVREASVEGARFVSLPITAAIITTCAAFLPLLFFENRFGNLIKVIPPVVSLMLIASLIESLLILPGHMALSPPKWVRRLGGKFRKTVPTSEGRAPKKHWFDNVESVYAFVLYRILRFKWLVFPVFGVLLFWTAHIFTNDMKFVLFPNEETTQVRVDIEAPVEVRRYEMAELTRKVEGFLQPYIGHELIGHRTEIARSRWGRPVQENIASMRVELVAREKREKSARQLIAEWRALADSLQGFTKIDFRTSRFGQESGSSIEIQVLENNDGVRNRVADSLAAALMANPALVDVEIDRPLDNPEFLLKLNRDRIKRLSINPANIAQTLRTLLEGQVLYEIAGDQEEVSVVLTAKDAVKGNIRDILALPVENSRDYLVPLSSVVSVEESTTPASIERERYKRVTKVIADLRSNSSVTPLEIADQLEAEVFPRLLRNNPNTQLAFTGEVKDTRESQGNFEMAIFTVIILIYGILALLFNSLLTPFIIMASIPFGVVGVVLAFKFHGMQQYGFFAAVGILGLMGVVINDSIVMLVKLKKRFTAPTEGIEDDSEPEVSTGVKSISDYKVAHVSKTRLRAVILTTLTTVAGLFPTAYGIAGYDAMLAEMMLAMGWGLLFGTLITLVLVPSLYAAGLQIRGWFAAQGNV